MIFLEEKKPGKYQIVKGPQFQNFTLKKCCFLTWRKASEIFDCYHEMSNNQKNKFLEPVPGVNVFFYFLLSYKLRETNDIFLIGSLVPVFENRKKCYITPPYSTKNQM